MQLYANFYHRKWFLESWDASHAVLGLIAVIAIQRAIHKILIAVFLSREFKHDETNRAWWTGRWYGRGLGAHVMSQPAREFIVKIIELSLWSSDLLLGHMLLFMMTPLILIPYFDRFHAMILCKPSYQGMFFVSLTSFILQSGFVHRSKYVLRCTPLSRRGNVAGL